LAPDKADFVRALRKRGSIVAMVGHPLDEAPALAAADVSITMGGGADWGSTTPSVILMDEDLTKLARLTEIAKRTMRTVRQNLAWSVSCSAVGVALALYGVLNPVLAALFVLVSGLAVVANSMRLEAAIQSQARK
jgi:P-type E1-E2 ATPase